MTSRRTAGAPWLPLATLGALLGAFALSSCAVGNRGTLHVSRKITIGQELMDLHEAREAGALSQEEYDEAKAKFMEMADSVDVVWISEED